MQDEETEDGGSESDSSGVETGNDPRAEPEMSETEAMPGADLADPRVGQGLLDAEMGPSSAMAHLYRGEIHRMKLWRERLDKTTNWAVIVMAAVLTWAFSSPENPHYVLLIGAVAIGMFLFIEARRYRAYDIWRSRVRTLQRNVWAPGLDPSIEPENEDWRRELAYDYCEPTLKITAEEALAHRLRRIYLPLLGVLTAAWVVRVTAFGSNTWPQSAAVGAIPGTLVTALVASAFVSVVLLALRRRTWHAHAELRTEALRKKDEEHPMWEE